MKKGIIYFIVIILICSLCTTSLATTIEIYDKEKTVNNVEENNTTQNDTIVNKEENDKETIEEETNKEENENLKEETTKEEDTKSLNKKENTELLKKENKQENEVLEQKKEETRKIENTEKDDKKVIEDGIYEIRSSANNSKTLNVSNRTYANSTNINLATNNDLKWQKFYIKYDQTKQAYIIKTLYGNKVLDVKSGKIANGTNVQLYEYNGTIAQQWNIVKIDENNYKIMSKNSNKCLDIQWRNNSRWFKYSNI